MTEAIPCLVRVGENIKKNRLIKLDRDQVTVGRSGDVTYAILSNMISRCHAIFKRQEDGKWSVTDNKSLNGVFVNGRQLTPFQACIMEDGDMVQFGVPVSTGLPAEYLYKFHKSLKVRVEKKNVKKAREDGPQTEASNQNPSMGSQDDSGSDEERKRKVRQPAQSSDKMDRSDTMSSKEAEYQARLAEMERLLHEKELKQSEVEKQLEKERQERENQMKEVEELKMKEQTILMELEDKQAQAEREKEELKQKMQAELEAHLKEKEEQLVSDLAEQKQKLVDEKKKVEESLQAEMAKALEEKNKEVEERLLSMKENLEKVIEKTDNEQKQLELQLNQTKEENEISKLQAAKAKEEVISNIVDMMEGELQCSICNELFIKATALNCAHVFCKLCINQWMKVKKECPNCRNKITTQMQTIALDSYIEKMTEQFSDEMKESRKALLAQRKEEQDKFDGVVVPGPSTGVPPVAGNNARGRGQNRRRNRGGRNNRGRGRNTAPQVSHAAVAAASLASIARTPAPVLPLHVTVSMTSRAPSAVPPRPIIATGRGVPIVTSRPATTPLLPIPNFALLNRPALIPVVSRIGASTTGTSVLTPAIVAALAARAVPTVSTSSSAPATAMLSTPSTTITIPGPSTAIVIPAPGSSGTTAPASTTNTTPTSGIPSTTLPVTTDTADTANTSAIVVSDNDDSNASSEENEEEENERFFRERWERRRWIRPTSEDEEIDSNDEEVDGDPSVYYGGYGRCFTCGSRGHWANGCPF